MTQLQVELQRDGQPLGTMSTGEFQMPGTKPWKALSKFPEPSAAAQTSLAERIKGAVAKATKPAGQFIGQVSRKTAELRNAQYAAVPRQPKEYWATTCPICKE